MKTKEKSINICMLGGGLWGTALANHLARKGNPVRLWEFFESLAHNLEKSRRHPHLPHLELSPLVRVTSDMADAASDAAVILFVLPSPHVRQTAAKLARILKSRKSKPWIINASKGIEPKTLNTMGEVIEEEISFLSGKIFTVSGPSFAREVSRDVPTSLVLAGPRSPMSKTLQQLLETDYLRIEVSTDRKGVELGGSLKNVLAIGCGLLDGMKAGANTKAAFITQGIAEMGRLIEAVGGRAETVYGLAGLGDLIATGTSPESRNRALGEKLGEGKSLEAALREIPTVTEGVESARSAHELIRSYKVACPLLEAVWQILHRGARNQKALDALGFRSHTAAIGRPGQFVESGGAVFGREA